MNIALARAQGDWIYFLGSDDCLYSNNVLSSVFISEYVQFDVIYGDVVSNQLGGRYAGPFTAEKLYSQNICHQALFARRTLFFRFGAFNTDYKIAADWEHNLRWFLNPSVSVRYIDLIISRYADFGLSSNSPDHLFDYDKDLLFIFWGRFGLPFSFKWTLLFRALAKAIRRRNLGLCFSTLLYLRYLVVPSSQLMR
jgi:hypothetical protein